LLKQNRAIIVAESDEHGGHSLGLLNPDIVLLNHEKKEYKPELCETQKNIWEIREWGIEEVKHLAGKSPIVLFKTGDINQGMKYDVDSPLASQVKIAYMNSRPWLKIKNLIAVRVDTGTGSHAFGNGDAEELFVDNLKKDKPGLDVQLMRHGLSEICGVLIDHAHHGPYVGSREWLKGNIAILYLRDLMMKDILRGRVPPQLVLRGHYHQVVEVFNRMNGADGNTYRSWLWVLPSLCGLNSFALQKTGSEYEITNGIVAFEVIDGKIREAFEFTKTFDVRERDLII
jgi:hypothetical protein